MSEQTSNLCIAHLAAESLAAFDWSNPGSAGLAGTHTRDVKFLDTTIAYGLSADGVAHIASVRTPRAKRGHGSARAAMERFLGEADWRGVSVKLECSPLDSRTSLPRLFRFYESLGFAPTGRLINPAGEPEMIRPCREIDREYSHVERYQWLRNKEGGQKFGNRQEIVPLTDEVFSLYFRAGVRPELNSFDVYHASYPEVTHASLVSTDRGGSWFLASVGTLDEVRPRPPQPEWAVKVDSFDSPEAKCMATTADSDYVHDLHRMIELGFTNWAIQLIRQGVDIEHPVFTGWRPLHVAAAYDRTDIASSLIAAGADVGGVDLDGMSPLHTAAIGGCLRVAEILVASNANVNAQDNFGQTPSHRAAVLGKTGVLRVLLAAGASMSIRNNDGHTILDVARASERNEVAAMVEAMVIEMMVNGVKRDRSSSPHV